MASRGECAASGASADKSVVSSRESGSTSAAATFESSWGGVCAAVDRSRATTRSPSSPCRAGKLTVTCSHLPSRRRALCGPPSAPASRVGSKASKPTQPLPTTLCAASIQPIAAAGGSASRLSITKMSRSGVGPDGRRLADPAGERDEERARRCRRTVTRLEEIRAPGARTDVLPPARWLAEFGALGGRLDLGRQRGDVLVKPRRARLEIAAPFAGLVVEQSRAAHQQVRECERAPQVERDRQCADDEQNI